MVSGAERGVLHSAQEASVSSFFMCASQNIGRLIGRVEGLFNMSLPIIDELDIVRTKIPVMKEGIYGSRDLTPGQLPIPSLVGNSDTYKIKVPAAEHYPR